jgi:hypothetical protein
MDIFNAQNIAWSAFEAFRSHPPSWWDENEVARFNKIVANLEAAYAVDL